LNYVLKWTSAAEQEYKRLKKDAESAKKSREASGKTKSSRQEGLFKQVAKTVQLLGENPRHPSLNTHEYSSMPHPYESGQKVFEAYAQNNTPGAYRIFWSYGPARGELTLLAITPHP
jgi:hypothetical protein